MSEQHFEKLARTNYLSSGGANCLSARAVDANYKEFDQRHRQVHQRTLHGWGVAGGLHVSGTIGSPGLTVSPGAALDQLGNLIVLAGNGKGIVETPAGTGQPVPVGASLALSTGAFAGKTACLIIEWAETRVPGDSEVTPCGQQEQMPVLRLLDAAALQQVQQPDKLVCLAVAEFDEGGNLLRLSTEAATVANLLDRRVIGIPAGQIDLRRAPAVAVGNPQIGEAVTTIIRPANDGGITLAGPDGDREVTLRLTADNGLQIETQAAGFTGTLAVADAVTAGSLVVPSTATAEAFSVFTVLGGGGALRTRNKDNGTALLFSINTNNERSGYIGVHNGAGAEAVKLTTLASGAGFLQTVNDAGQPAFRITGGSDYGYAAIYNNGNEVTTMTSNTGGGGFLETKNQGGQRMVRITGSTAGSVGVYKNDVQLCSVTTAGNGGFVGTSNESGQNLVRLTSDADATGGWVSVYENNKELVTLTSGASDGGLIETKNLAGQRTVQLSGSSGGFVGAYYNGNLVTRLTTAGKGGFVGTANDAGHELVRLTSGLQTTGGWVGVYENNKEVVSLTSSQSDAGFIRTKNQSDQQLVQISGSTGGFIGVYHEDKLVSRITTKGKGGYMSTENEAGHGLVRLTSTVGETGGWVTVLEKNKEVVTITCTTTGAGFIETKLANGNPAVRISTSGSGDAQVGHLSVRDKDGNTKLWLDGNGSKNFVMPHPKDARKNIVYAALEGPECAAYVRGRFGLQDGSAQISFPEHFALVVNPETVTVQLTPRSAESLGLAVVEQSATGFQVRELHAGSGSYDFDFTATGVRRDLEHFQPVVDKGFTAFGQPTDEMMPPQQPPLASSRLVPGPTMAGMTAKTPRDMAPLEQQDSQTKRPVASDRSDEPVAPASGDMGTAGAQEW